MQFDFNIFSKVLLFSGIVTAFTSFLIFQHKGGAVRWFGFLMVSIALWAITYSFELATVTLDQMLFWINLEYIGISFLPALWIVFVIKFIGKEGWTGFFNLLLIFLIPILTLLFVWTNNLHHLHYAAVGVDRSGPFPLLDITSGIWYKIFTIYFYAMLAWGIFLLVRKFQKADLIYRRQNRMIIIGAVFPWVVNLIYLLGYRPFHHIDLTPYAFIITVLSISFAILRFKLFDVVPVAREKVLELMSDGMMVLDSKNRIVDVNAEMKRILGKLTIGFHHTKLYPDETPGNFIGLNYKKLFPQQDVFHLMVNERIQDRTEIKVENGEVKYFEVNLTPLFNKDTVYSGIILLFREITEKKLAERKLLEQSEQLIALNKLKDKLFTIISHDLQGPFKSLLDIFRMSGEGNISEEEMKALIPYAIKYTGNITDLLENLLHWSKSQLQGEVINKEKFDFKVLSRDQLNLIEKRAREKSIHLKDNIAMGTEVYADKNMMRLVLRNLVGNAVKFCNEGDDISISAVQNGKFTTIEVSDTGIGITADVQKKLFGLEGYTSFGTKKEKGTGIGLLLCKEFVEKNGGKIWMESEPGKGSRFLFSIPKKQN